MFICSRVLGCCGISPVAKVSKRPLRARSALTMACTGAPGACSAPANGTIATGSALLTPSVISMRNGSASTGTETISNPNIHRTRRFIVVIDSPQG